MKRVLFGMLFRLYAIRVSFLRKLIMKIVIKTDNGQFWSTELRKIYKEYHGITIGIGTYGGCFHTDTIPSGTKFGNYCSIAQRIYIFNANHPEEFITTHPITYNPSINFVKKEQIKRTHLNIGNDVWIGQNVIITSKVKKIGNGAIIGAGAVVTKDVPPYSVVGGVPAKIIKKRFKDDDINKIERSRWWNLDPKQIREHIDLFSNIENIDLIRDLKD